MLSVSPDLLELDPDLIESLSDDGDENVLHHPRQEEDHRDKVEGGLPGVQTISGPGNCLDHKIIVNFRFFLVPVHDIDPALLRGSLVHSEHTRCKLPEPGEADVKPRIIDHGRLTF